MKAGWTFYFALPIASLLSVRLALPQEAAPAAKAGGKPGPETYLPYYQAPMVKGGPVARTADGHPDMQGYWTSRFNQSVYDVEDHPVARPGIPAGKGSIVDPPDHHIPYQPWALEKVKDLAANHTYDEPEAHCFLSGIPHEDWGPFGFQILQPSGYFLMLFEARHVPRIIPTDGRPHISADIKLYEGDSVGHWEGDTLVIDTTNQNGRGWFDMVGHFASPNIHVVERFTPVDSNTISVEATIEDPTLFTRPWKVAGSFGRRIDPDYEQMEFACVEGNYDLNHYTESAGGKARSSK